MVVRTLLQFRSISNFIQQLIVVNLLSCAFSAVSDGVGDYLLCRRCGHEITSASNLIHVPSVLAHRQRNDTILGNRGVLIQLFKNPQGNHFEVVTTTEADIHLHDKSYSADTWFPGYEWTISVCPQCGFHLGWVFENIEENINNEKKSFVGLILNNLLHQSDADAMMAVPKSYRS